MPQLEFKIESATVCNNMQQNGALYQRSNGVQRRDAKQVLDEFAPLFRWRSDGQDSLLDIGCGTGDVTIDYVLPLMPVRFARLVGADVSDGMLAHARATFQRSRISFQKLDIGGKTDGLIGGGGEDPFDHITSFYCLHWVQDQRQAMKNIYKLLAPGGDCLLAFLAQNPIFEIYKRMATNRKWAPFMMDVQRFISPYQHSASPADDLSKMLYLAGFSEYRVVVREKMFVYDGLDVLKS